jgi:hypothetical protein
MNDRLFDALNKWVTSRNINDGSGLNEAHNEIMKFIEATYSTLINEMETLNSDIMDIKARLRKPDNRDLLIKELRAKQNKVQEIELYLSSAFGRFSPEKFGQEVNWAWFDLAIVSGINDVMGVYDRQYNENTPNSTMYFVNLT